MNDEAWQKWFEAIWADREERIYRDFFGDIGPGIFPIPAKTFESLGKKDVDPRYLFHGVFECPPTNGRVEWVYVSSGMSNAWGESPETVDPAGYSGLGFEFTLHTKVQARWAIQLMHWVMAVQLLVASGDLEGGGLLERNDRIPLGAPLGKKDGAITHVLVAEPPTIEDGGYPREFALASGRVDVMLLLGISARESDFARSLGEGGAEALVKLLKHHGVFPVTDVQRASMI